MTKKVLFFCTPLGLKVLNVHSWKYNTIRRIHGESTKKRLFKIMLGCWDLTIWKKCVFGDVALIIPRRLYTCMPHTACMHATHMHAQTLHTCIPAAGMPHASSWTSTCSMHEYCHHARCKYKQHAHKHILNVHSKLTHVRLASGMVCGCSVLVWSVHVNTLCDGSINLCIHGKCLHVFCMK